MQGLKMAGRVIGVMALIYAAGFALVYVWVFLF